MAAWLCLILVSQVCDGFANFYGPTVPFTWDFAETLEKVRRQALRTHAREPKGSPCISFYDEEGAGRGLVHMHATAAAARITLSQRMVNSPSDIPSRSAVLSLLLLTVSQLGATAGSPTSNPLTVPEWAIPHLREDRMAEKLLLDMHRLGLAWHVFDLTSEPVKAMFALTNHSGMGSADVHIWSHPVVTSGDLFDRGLAAAGITHMSHLCGKRSFQFLSWEDFAKAQGLGSWLTGPHTLLIQGLQKAGLKHPQSVADPARGSAPALPEPKTPARGHGARSPAVPKGPRLLWPKPKKARARKQPVRRQVQGTGNRTAAPVLQVALPPSAQEADWLTIQGDSLCSSPEPIPNVHYHGRVPSDDFTPLLDDTIVREMTCTERVIHNHFAGAHWGMERGMHMDGRQVRYTPGREGDRYLTMGRALCTC